MPREEVLSDGSGEEIHEAGYFGWFGFPCCLVEEGTQVIEVEVSSGFCFRVEGLKIAID